MGPRFAHTFVIAAVTSAFAASPPLIAQQLPRIANPDAYVPGLGADQLPPSGPPLPMREAEACRVEFTDRGHASLRGLWGGQIALYEVATAETGAAVSVKRQIIEDREHLPPLVRLDQFEACVRKWDFGGPGVFSVRLLGGSIFHGVWVIDVMQDSRIFRLRFPVAQPNP